MGIKEDIMSSNIEKIKQELLAKQKKIDRLGILMANMSTSIERCMNEFLASNPKKIPGATAALFRFAKGINDFQESLITLQNQLYPRSNKLPTDNTVSLVEQGLQTSLDLFERALPRANEGEIKVYDRKKWGKVCDFFKAMFVGFVKAFTEEAFIQGAPTTPEEYKNSAEGFASSVGSLASSARKLVDSSEKKGDDQVLPPRPG